MNDLLSKVLQALGATAAIAGLVTFVGGAMLWIRFDELDLPADRAVALLPNELLIVIGAHALIAPLLVGAAILLFLAFFFPLDENGDVKPWFWYAFMPVIALAAGVVVALQLQDLDFFPEQLTMIAALVVGVVVIAMTARGVKLVRYIAWVTFAVFALCGSLLAVVRTTGDPRMEPVAVLVGEDADNRHGIAGFLVGESADRIYIAAVPGNGDATHAFADARVDRFLALSRDDVVRMSVREPTGIGTGDAGRDYARTLMLDLMQDEAREAGAPPATVTTSKPVKAFAPLVHIHAREQWYPMSARGFLDNSELKWARDGGCRDRRVAAGASRPAELREAHGTLVAERLRKPASAYRQPAVDDKCRPGEQTFRASDVTRPFERTGRPAGLDEREGFYLDLDDDVRKGHRKAEKHGAQRFLHGVPVYWQRDVKGRRVSLTYWFLYGLSEPPGPRPATRLVVHEGDWERVVVQLRRLKGEDDAYRPLSVRYHFHNEYREVPWAAVSRAVGPGGKLDNPTHPVVYSARASHASFWRAATYESEFKLAGQRRFAVDDDARACLDCPLWETWRSMRPVRKEAWYGFGGAWGRVGSGGGMTGPLGPSEYKP
jgi:hypothetical protein